MHINQKIEKQTCLCELRSTEAEPLSSEAGKYPFQAADQSLIPGLGANCGPQVPPCETFKVYAGTKYDLLFSNHSLPQQPDVDRCGKLQQ